MKFIITALIIFTVAIIGYLMFLPVDSGSDEMVEFQIERGQGIVDISSSLKEEGLLRSELMFRLYAVLNGSTRSIQAGYYEVSPAMTPASMLEKFVTGDVMQDRVTIPEGWNVRDIAGFLEERGIATRDDVYGMVGSPGVSGDTSSVSDFLSNGPDYSSLQDRPDHVGLEGYLFPDTYYLAKGESASSLVHKMISNFDSRFTDEMKQRAEERGMSVFEVVILASLLEKEVTGFEDKQTVAGIIERRMEIDMPLQIDATISYLTDKRTVNISVEETRIESPYNTYQNRGLPLGPISNPGIDSIEAALDPVESPYLYYLSTPEGETIFSRTHDEHVEAKNRYLRGN